MKKYIIVDLRTQEMFRDVEGSVQVFDDYDCALLHCGIYELENVWVCELVRKFGTEIDSK